MADIGKSYRTDKQAEIEGVWVPLNDGIEVRVARIGSAPYLKIWEREVRPYRAQMDRGLLSDEKQTEILIKVMSEAVLLDWKNIEYPSGKKFPYSPANASTLLTELPDFRADIVFLANQQATYRAEEIEAAEKN